jgi:hypothetical protein
MKNIFIIAAIGILSISCTRYTWQFYSDDKIVAQFICARCHYSFDKNNNLNVQIDDWCGWCYDKCGEIFLTNRITAIIRVPNTNRGMNSVTIYEYKKVSCTKMSYEESEATIFGNKK